MLYQPPAAVGGLPVTLVDDKVRPVRNNVTLGEQYGELVVLSGVGKADRLIVSGWLGGLAWDAGDAAQWRSAGTNLEGRSQAAWCRVMYRRRRRALH